MKANSVIKKAKRLLIQSKIDINSMNINKNCSIDLEKIAEHLGITILNATFPTDKISGVFFNKDGRLYIGVNKDHSKTRRRFTIAHELGHYMLHANEKLHLDDSSKFRETPDTFYRAEDITNKNETQANHFAAELLMPEELIEHCISDGIISTVALAAKFNVSEQAMTYRLVYLGYL